MVFAMFLVLLLPTTLILILWMQTSRTRTLVNKLPGPPALPFIGNAHILEPGSTEFFAQTITFWKEFSNKTGIFRLWLGMHPVIVVTKAETAEAILTNSKNITKSFVYQFLVPWLKTGLLTSTGEKWHSRRKLLTPTFHFKILSDFLQVFNEQANVMVARLDGQVGKGGFDVMPYVTLCALDIICDTAMGKCLNVQRNSDSEYVKALYRVTEIIVGRMRKPWEWPDFLFRFTFNGREHSSCLRTLHEFTKKVIRERRAEMEDQRRNGATPVITESSENEDYLVKPRKRLAFLDLLLEMSYDSGFLTDQNIREEVDTFMFEGHDTTAAALTWAIHLVGANPEVQTKLQEELDRIFGDSNRPITMDDLKEMKYLECVIKESLRLFPSVPFFGRRISDDFCIGGYTIPKGATVLVGAYFLHRDSDHFPDPERFDPDRWLLENLATMHPFCYIPFSAGLRNCIGQKFAMMEEKALLAYIFRRFEVTSLQSRDDLNPSADLILRPEKGVRIRLDTRRTTTTSL